ncbi:MAG TPA: hypothetical protein VGH43_18570 [Jatrophihabitans sp.]|jgi:hypothetical protein
MYDYFSYANGVRQSHELSRSALPDAPVVDDQVAASAPMRFMRSWSAARLRTMARGTDHLANRVDPACA